jgi:hypothetical protein
MPWWNLKPVEVAMAVGMEVQVVHVEVLSFWVAASIWHVEASDCCSDFPNLSSVMTTWQWQLCHSCLNVSFICTRFCRICTSWPRSILSHTQFTIFRKAAIVVHCTLPVSNSSLITARHLLKEPTPISYFGFRFCHTPTQLISQSRNPTVSKCWAIAPLGPVFMPGISRPVPSSPLVWYTYTALFQYIITLGS